MKVILVFYFVTQHVSNEYPLGIMGKKWMQGILKNKTPIGVCASFLQMPYKFLCSISVPPNTLEKF